MFRKLLSGEASCAVEVDDDTSMEAPPLSSMDRKSGKDSTRRRGAAALSSVGVKSQEGPQGFAPYPTQSIDQEINQSINPSLQFHPLAHGPTNEPIIQLLNQSWNQRIRFRLQKNDGHVNTEHSNISDWLQRCDALHTTPVAIAHQYYSKRPVQFEEFPTLARADLDAR